MVRKLLIASTFALSGVLVGCSSDDMGTEETRDTIEQAGDEARNAARDGLASLRTDAERIADDVQARNAPEAKQQLLDRCRDALERARKANAENADRVERICDRIRDADIKNVSVWNEIKQEIEQVT